MTAVLFISISPFEKNSLCLASLIITLFRIFQVPYPTKLKNVGMFVRPRTPFDAGGCSERFESPGISSPTSEPAAFTIPPAEHFSSMGNCPALQGIVNRIAGFP
ncbi:MAG: hypothetical protein UHM52_08310, partial [Acutalibacteraceae bacterium]|nr:hypothetical protein [Acutalibacteraceae bacterium]